MVVILIATMETGHEESEMSAGGENVQNGEDVGVDGAAVAAAAVVTETAVQLIL